MVITQNEVEDFLIYTGDASPNRPQHDNHPEAGAGHCMEWPPRNGRPALLLGGFLRHLFGFLLQRFLYGFLDFLPYRLLDGFFAGFVFCHLIFLFCYYFLLFFVVFLVVLTAPLLVVVFFALVGTASFLVALALLEPIFLVVFLPVEKMLGNPKMHIGLLLLIDSL